MFDVGGQASIGAVATLILEMLKKSRPAMEFPTTAKAAGASDKKLCHADYTMDKAAVGGIPDGGGETTAAIVADPKLRMHWRRFQEERQLTTNGGSDATELCMPPMLLEEQTLVADGIFLQELAGRLPPGSRDSGSMQQPISSIASKTMRERNAELRLGPGNVG